MKCISKNEADQRSGSASNEVLNEVTNEVYQQE
jgi:hypothetical protein